MALILNESKDHLCQHTGHIIIPENMGKSIFFCTFRCVEHVHVHLNFAGGFDMDKYVANFTASDFIVEKLGILGGNGLGKSTLLKTLVGQLAPLAGEVPH